MLHRAVTWFAMALVLLIVAALLLMSFRQQQGNRRAQLLFDDFRVEPVADFGSTSMLRILPLMEYHSSDPSLRSEVGLSYLVDTDEHRILYDVGHNATGESPSPLQQNMQALGVELAGIDTVFISHNHFDHVGGMENQKKQRFSIGVDPVPLPDGAP